MEALLVTFGLGLGSAASPCLLPLYPAYLAYLTESVSKDAEGGQKRRISGFLGLAILAGVLTVMIGVGVVFAVLTAPLGQFLTIAVPAMRTKKPHPTETVKAAGIAPAAAACPNASWSVDASSFASMNLMIA